MRTSKIMQSITTHVLYRSEKNTWQTVLPHKSRNPNRTNYFQIAYNVIFIIYDLIYRLCEMYNVVSLLTIRSKNSMIE